MDTTLHDLIHQLKELRTEKTRLEYEAKKVSKLVTIKEREIIDAMDDQQIVETRSEDGKITLSEAVYPHVESWPDFYEWIWTNKYFHFLERRATALAYREALGQNIPVPGVTPYTKRKLTFKET